MKATLILIAVLISCPVQASVLADHQAVAEFDNISTSVFQEVRNKAKIFYGHTSHGSQIMTGIDMLAAENSLYASPSFDEMDSDLGHTGSVVWAEQTRTWLDANPETNVVMWSWCGGASDNTPEGITTYVQTMTQLETDYPTVAFIYMTGHLDGTGIDGLLYQNINRIREYCADTDKILFDFAYIDCWDPDGNFYPDETDACGWCTTWCASPACPDCASCAHSHCFNCYQKGKAFWWMMANISQELTPAKAMSFDSLKSLFR